jgi:DNA-directed RNA polymerase subunit RPC12/RpoP
MAVTEDPRYACYKCGEELVFEVKIGRRDTCPNCASYLHCCFNCSYWDPNVHNQCTENQGEFIRDRAEGNFCLYFSFRHIGEDRSTEVDAAKARLNSLFTSGKISQSAAPGLTPSPKKEDEARARLEALFKK